MTETRISFVTISFADNHLIRGRILCEANLWFSIQLIQSGFINPSEVVSLHQSREEEVELG